MFRHFWTDERLTVAKKLTLNSVKGFWHPDTFVVNEKKVKLMSDPDRFVQLCCNIFNKIYYCTR
jgi:hypothetical protein